MANPTTSTMSSPSSVKLTVDLDISRCCICYDNYNRTNRAPISMPCGHTFCHGCVRRLTTKILFSCGICRTISLVGWAPTKKNVALIQALEKMNLLATDDTKEELDSSPLGETVDERQLHNVASKDMLSYGKRSLQVLACHMKSRYDDLDEAVLAVNRTIVKIAGRLIKNKVSGEPPHKPEDEFEGTLLFEDSEEVMARVATNRGESVISTDDDDSDIDDFSTSLLNNALNSDVSLDASRDEDDVGVDVIDLTNDNDDAPIVSNWSDVNVVEIIDLISVDGDASDDSEADDSASDVDMSDDNDDVSSVNSLDANRDEVDVDVNVIDLTDDDDDESNEDPSHDSENDDGANDVDMSDDDDDVSSVNSLDANRDEVDVDVNVIDLTDDDDDESNEDPSHDSENDDGANDVDMSDDDDDVSSADASDDSEDDDDVSDVNMSDHDDDVSSADSLDANRCKYDVNGIYLSTDEEDDPFIATVDTSDDDWLDRYV